MNSGGGYGSQSSSSSVLPSIELWDTVDWTSLDHYQVLGFLFNMAHMLNCTGIRLIKALGHRTALLNPSLENRKGKKNRGQRLLSPSPSASEEICDDCASWGLWRAIHQGGLSDGHGSNAP